MTTGWKVFSVLWPLLVASCAFIGNSMRAADPQAKIAVVDRDAIALALADRLGAEAAIRETDHIAERLASQGFVVLDQRYVLHAPSESVVRP